MSLGIAFKGAEGIVLAADSRVTLFAQIPGPNPALQVQIPATFDNATKVLRVAGQKYVGAVTYGVGAIGQRAPRTAHSFIPEFEQSLGDREGQMAVEDFAGQLGDFYMKQWSDAGMPTGVPGQDMVFLVGGYDKGAAYGRVFQVLVPTAQKPKEWNPGTDFGITWGGQAEFVNRLIQGFDEQVLPLVQDFLKLPSDKMNGLRDHLRMHLSARLPYQFLPLQDCVDLAIFLIRATINIQGWAVGIRGVGGAIDVATITRTDGFNLVQQKRILGERTTESFVIGAHDK